jgi:AcrR family transcriptional regulator
MPRATTNGGRSRKRAEALRPSRPQLERERILDGAILLLLETGPGQMRLAELARGLDVTPSALHYHFPGGKEEVVSALFEREERRVLDAMTGAMATATTPHGQLLALATARLENAARLARLHRSDAPRDEAARREGTTASEIQDYVLRRRHEFLETERALIAGIFRDAVGRGASRASVELRAVAFQGALFNVTRTFALETKRNAATVLTELVDLFFQGIARP